MSATKTPPRISFEFFPPPDAEGEARLWETVKRLEPLRPAFFSVTYGAGGSTRSRSYRAVRRILDEAGAPPAAHLTCVGASRAEVDAMASEWWEAGVRHVVALRGDPPAGASRFEPHPQGYCNAADLVAGLRRIAPFEVSVGGYPEVHPDSADLTADLDNLKAKVDAGASRVLTQFFFDAEVFLRFRDRAAAHGITAELVPGIMPVHHFARISRFAGLCGASVPDWLAERFEGLDEDPDTRRLVAASIAAELCQRLRQEGVEAFHFYTLNRPDLTYAVCRHLGVRPSSLDKAA